MSPDTLDRIESELQAAYPQAQTAEDAGRKLVKLPTVQLPPGCAPSTTSALVVLDGAQPKPRLLVKHKPTTPGGATPRNVNAEIVGGESWFAFSYNVSWDENRHTGQQFVEAAVRRFAKNE